MCSIITTLKNKTILYTCTCITTQLLINILKSMNKNFIITIASLIAIALIAILVFSNDEEMAPTEASHTQEAETEHHTAIDHHLEDASISNSDDTLSADLNALGLMPLNNESGAVGYGLITTEGTDAIMVSATHAGLLDSEVQKDASDPVWHNHLVKLGAAPACGDDPGVIDITFESPGKSTVKESGLIMLDLPPSFTGTHSLNQETISFAPGIDVQSVVQFNLEPKSDDDGNLTAVCVTEIEEIPFEVMS